MEKSLDDQNINENSFLLFKMKYIKSPSYTLDTTSLELFFTQIKDEVINGKYNVPEKISLYLAALQLQSSLGDFTNLEVSSVMFVDSITVSLFSNYIITGINTYMIYCLQI